MLKLPKEMRLRKKEISKLFDNSNNITIYPYKALYQPDSSIKFGIAVSTKNFKNATDRNRIKRVTKEIFRLNQQLMTKQQFLFLIYISKKKYSTKFCSNALKTIIRRIN